MRRTRVWTFLWIICLSPTALSRRYQLKRYLRAVTTELSQPHSHSIKHASPRRSQNLINNTFNGETHRYEVETVDNGTLPTDKGKTTDKPGEDLKRSASNSPTHSALKGGKAFTVRYSMTDAKTMEINVWATLIYLTDITLKLLTDVIDTLKNEKSKMLN